MYQKAHQISSIWHQHDTASETTFFLYRIWFYWINPNAHTVYGLISTQFLESNARVDVYGERVPLTLFIQERFGFHHSFIGYNVLVLCGWILVFLLAGALALRKLNFLKM